MFAMTDDPQITICPPGKRAGPKAVLRQPAGSTIPFTTQTALASPPKPRLAPAAHNDRRSAQERVEAAERADAVSVALAQPHRAGSDDKMLESPLGAFCARSWPPRFSDHGHDLNSDHRRDMYRAGLLYGEIVHQHRVLIGLGSGSRTQSEGQSVTLTDAELRARCDAARIKRDGADAVLRAVFPNAVSAMMRVAVDEIPPTPYQEDLLRHCLYVLAVHFGVVKRGRFSSNGE